VGATVKHDETTTQMERRSRLDIGKVREASTIIAKVEVAWVQQ
jgi:hypothetical protein